MAAKSNSAKLPERRLIITLPPGPPRLATRAQLQALADAIGRYLGGLRIEIRGADAAATTPDGVTFEVNPGDEGGDHPWKVGRTTEGFGIMGGSYNTIAIPFTELSSTFSGWVWIEASWTLTLVDGYVWPAELTGAVLDWGAAVPADEPEVAKFYVPLVEMSNGRVITQAATRSISATVCDRAADGGGVHTILQS